MEVQTGQAPTANIAPAPAAGAPAITNTQQAAPAAAPVVVPMMPQQTPAVAPVQGATTGTAENTPDESKWDASTAAYIAKLRGESADRRIANKSLEGRVNAIAESLGLETDTQVTPEQQINSLQGQTHDLQFNNMILQSALHNGVGADQLEYYSFLVNKHVENMNEGDEFSEESLGEILGKIRAVGSVAAPAATSITDGNTGGVAAPAAGVVTDVTLQQFQTMTVSEKSKLFTDNRQAYDALHAQTKLRR